MQTRSAIIKTTVSIFHSTRARYAEQADLATYKVEVLLKIVCHEGEESREEGCLENGHHKDQITSETYTGEQGLRRLPRSPLAFA